MVIPAKLPVTYDIISIGDKRLRWLHSDGTVYATDTYGDNNKLYKSANWGSTWSLVANLGEPIYQVRKLKNNELLVMAFKKIYKSDNNEGNFAEVFAIPTATGTFSYWGQLDVYDRMVFICEYGPAGLPSNRYAWYSPDYGNAGTWQLIFTAPNPVTDHTHDIMFDPYDEQGIIWALTGDGRNTNLIHWSDNFGRSWNTLRGNDTVRATCIIPLPDCILFGGDTWLENAVYRINRPKNGSIMWTDVEIEKHILKRRLTHKNHPPWWATKPAIVYGNRESAKAYFGFLQSVGYLDSPSIVWVTDGYEFKPVWIENKIATLTGGLPPTRAGITSVFGPDNNGVIAADLCTMYGAEYSHILKIQT